MKKTINARNSSHPKKIAFSIQDLNSFIAMAWFNKEGQFTEINSSFSKLLGFSSKQIIKRRFQDLLVSLKNEKEFKKCLRLKSGTHWSGEMQLQTKGEKSVWLHCIFLGYGEKSTFKILGLFYDLSLQKHSESILLESAKMAAIGQMAGGIAHEVSTPLMSLSMHVQMILKQLQTGRYNPDDLVQKIHKMDSTITLVQNIVKSLKVVSRDSQKDAFEDVKIEAIIQDAIELCQHRENAAGVELRIKLGTGTQILARSSQILQVLVNLMNNAYDAIEDQKQKWIEIATESQSDKVKILITDCGLGIPEEVQKKMMAAFFTTKEVGKGTGLGLGISQEIVKEHGGRLYYNPKSPHTQFVIELPLKIR